MSAGEKVSVRTEDAFFAALNTKDGFKSYFESVFFCDAIKRRYIIKGGPGTGKSSFMRRVALYAQNMGRRVTYYYCSSDTSSLDGIVIDGQIAIFDGTAPHSYDTTLPGACDEIINLGEYWNSEGLMGEAEAIKSYNAEKRAAYAYAYGYLAAAGKILETQKAVIDSCINKEKLSAAVGRACDKLRGESKRGEGEVLTRQVSAFGTRGEAHLDTLSRMASTRHVIEDHYGTASLFLSELITIAKREGHKMYVSYHTVDPSIPTEVLFVDTGDYFCIGDGDTADSHGEHNINMKRFVDPQRLASVRYCYRAAKQAYRSLVDLALHELNVAGEIHANIEKIYVANMNFDALQRFCSDFLKKL